VSAATIEKLDAAPAPPPPAPSADLVRRIAGAGRPVVLAAVSLGLFLLAWHLLTTYRVDAIMRFGNIPTPGAVLARAARAFADTEFQYNIVISCRRIAVGFILATLLGVPAGMVMGRWRLAREAMLPVFEVLRPIPAIAWVPLSIMLWPTNEQSIVFITFIGSFFPILLNTLLGMSTVDPVLVRAARCLGAGETAIFREVYLPAILPQMFTGLAVGMGVAWVSLIAAEMIAGQYGIGYFTWEAYSLVQYPDIVLGMICIGVLGLASSTLIRLVARVAMPWSATR